MAATIVNGIKLAANVEQGDDGRGIDPESLTLRHIRNGTRINSIHQNSTLRLWEVITA
ncbi:hypothetical protein AC35_1761 [Escherichia coli 3-475-03_S3_C2]|uniref:Uncharacterized protein n=1 Tax=Shigella boydii 4444-74 TaxID=766140 RepID=I6DW97_SHIBO|nr:hypothetical protein UMNF18_3232 [Escherichia coli UMNF18]AOM44405.1 hypothetical protein FORC28_1414 [Escherichia coli]EFZ42355.1 hypothetical protein ECEPECA14_1973 [Escherichia coli EPECa14]EFZ55058.1 hypothetical protein SS53G_0552 [Shigella sonnei 53G]EHV86151.1 hypothetical protein ECDEC7C_2985 [Escherichia coli DEC7C]EHW26954.1 hypothetical protein ECDEC8E_3359 [Escherichia coli DEC8E]EHW35348.1 hypothetical protein ECDEC9A_3311 [Escherichia coli DEC9A]EHW61196.1 hypothetical prote